MNTANALLIATAALGLTGAPGCGTDDQDASIGLEDLTVATVAVQRDGVVNHYPRQVEVIIPLPLLAHGCASLAPSVSMTLDGQPPFAPPTRGGVSPEPGYFGGVACEMGAGAGFLLSDDGGQRVLRFTDGDRTAELAFEVPALEPIELVAPTGGHARPADLLTVHVPQSFYDSRSAPHPTPHAIDQPATVTDAIHFDAGLFRDASTPFEDFNAGVLGAVGIGIDDVTVQVPSYATAGAKRFYLTYGFGGDWSPMTVDRCQGFGGCTGTARDNTGLLGPIDLTIDTDGGGAPGTMTAPSPSSLN
jgi:hypothetical protein